MLILLKKTLLYCTLLLILGSCGDCVSGTGEIHEEERLMPKFSALSTEVQANVIIRSDSGRAAPGIVIRAQQEILPLLTATVEEGTLRIRSARCYSADVPVEIIVYSGKLHALDLAGAGNVKSEITFLGDTVDLLLGGAGELDIPVNAGLLRVELNGSGNVRCSGNTDRLTIHLDGSGNIGMHNVSAGAIEAVLNGSGNIECHVREKADFTVNGSGNILYSGSDRNITTQNNGSGEIRHIE
jgi:hypothetical protein